MAYLQELFQVLDQPGKCQPHNYYSGPGGQFCVLRRNILANGSQVPLARYVVVDYIKGHGPGSDAAHGVPFSRPADACYLASAMSRSPRK
jgi:hypothetical protein